jgi:hypothetical protein
MHDVGHNYGAVAVSIGRFASQCGWQTLFDRCAVFNICRRRLRTTSMAMSEPGGVLAGGELIRWTVFLLYDIVHAKEPMSFVRRQINLTPPPPSQVGGA